MSNNCFIIRLRDGLGNQLFQYALGRKLSISHQAELFFDTTWYEPIGGVPQPRTLGIQCFDVKGRFGSDPRWQRYWTHESLSGWLKWQVEQRCLPPHWRRYIQEDPRRFLHGKAFDGRILKAAPGTYLFGWWCSPEYFAGIESELRRDLVLNTPLSARAKEFCAKLNETESVAVHVRRSDYLKVSQLGILGPGYYARAAAILCHKLYNPRFFVFSDDTEAAREMLRGVLPNYEIVALESDATPAMNLWVMASCKHFISANSTFSWWGAWLSSHQGKHVIVPRKWFVGADIEVDDIYPPQWVCLEA